MNMLLNILKDHQASGYYQYALMVHANKEVSYWSDR